MKTSKYSLRRRRLKGRGNHTNQAHVGFLFEDERLKATSQISKLVRADVATILRTSRGTVYGIPLFGVAIDKVLYANYSENTVPAILGMLQEQVNSQYPIKISFALSRKAKFHTDKCLELALNVSFTVNGDSYQELLELTL